MLSEFVVWVQRPLRHEIGYMDVCLCGREEHGYMDVVENMTELQKAI